ncbi:hypothetical protein Tco_1418755 [Tanacetum coccineum]
MSTRSTSSNLFSPLRDPESLIRRRNFGEPSSLFNFEEIMSIPHNNMGPPPAGPPLPNNGPPPVVRPNGPAPRSMKLLCQPSINGRGRPIAPIPIEATDFGLRHHMIQQVQNTCQFHGLPGDDANRHIDKFLEVTQHMKQNGVSDDALRLSLFPYSLTHHAIAWYDRLPRNSIHSFDDMMRKFLSKYFSPSMTQFDLKPHMQSQSWTDINADIQQHLQKLYNTNKASLKVAHWVINPETGTYDVESIRQRRPENITPADWDAQLSFWNDPRNQARAAQNRQKTGQRARSSYDGRQGIPDEMLRLQRLGSNTKTGVPYTEEEIMAIVRKGKRCWQGIVGTRRGWKSPPLNPLSTPPMSKTSKRFESSPEFGGPSGGGGCGDDEPGGDEDGDEDEEDGDSLMFGRFFPEKFRKKSGKLPAVQAVLKKFADLSRATCRPGYLTETLRAPPKSLEKVARERIPGDLSPSTYPRRHVARDEFPQRQVARERREMSLGIMDDSGSHNRNLQAILTNGVVSCLILSDEEYVEGFCDQ